jgi:mannosyltransferase
MWAAARCCHTARGNRVSTRAEVTDDVLERTGLLGSRLAFAQLCSWVGGQIARVGGWYWVLPVGLSFVVTAVGASRPTLWSDELATWSAARRSWSQLWHLLGHEDLVIAPYYVFMHGWVRLFGDSELSLRMPSILAVTATAGLVAVLGRRLYSPRVGLLAGVLFAVLPNVSRYGQEARAIAFTAMFAALATLVLVVVLDEPRWWRWLLYAAAVIALGAASVIALLLLVAHGVFAAGHWWQTRNRQPVWWLVSATGALLVLSPLIYFGQRQLRQIAWVPKPGEIPGLRQQEAWTAFPDGTDIAGSIGLGGLLLGLGLVGAKFAGRAWGMLLAWALGLKFLLYLVSMFGPQSYWVGRYLYFVTPALVLLAALTLSWLGIRHTVAVLVVFALLAVPLHSDIRSRSGHNFYDGPSVVNYLTPRLQPGDVALFGNSGQHGPRDLLRYYGLPASRLPDVLATKSSEEVGGFRPTECTDTARCLSGVSRAWLFLVRPSADLYERMPAAKGSFLRENFQVTQSQEFGAITVFLLERRVSTTSG